MLALMGMLLWLVSGMAAGLWMMQANMEYLRLYRTLRGIDLLPPYERYVQEPWRWPIEGFVVPWRAFRAMWERQTDPELERARQRVNRRSRLTTVIVWFGVALPIILSILENS